MTRPRQRYGCPSMGSTCADFNDTGESCQYCKQPTIPVYPCACGGWTVNAEQPCVECAAKERVDAGILHCSA